MTEVSTALTYGSVLGVAGGISIASGRLPPVGPNLLQIFFRIIGYASATGFFFAIMPYFHFRMPHQRFGIDDVVCVITMICVGWLTAKVVTGMALVILKHSYS